MSPVMIGTIFSIVFFVLVFIGMPLSFSLIFIGLTGTAFITSWQTAFEMVSQNTFEKFTSFNLLVIPMYVWMGYIAHESGIGGKVYKFAYTLIGHIRGGLAISAEVASAVFGAICGSAPATAAIMGTISLPEMKKYNYDMKIATASIASGGILGSLIPPSVMVMIYGIATQTSIQKLFKASIIPGIILLLFYSIVIYILTWRDPSLAPPGKKSTWAERKEALLNGGLLEVAIVFGLSIGGLFAGWFTPSEAGSVGVAGILLVTVIEGSLSWEGFKKSFQDTIKFNAMILLIFAGATIFGRFLAITTLPTKLAIWVGTLDIPNFFIMLIILIIYLVLGCLIDIPALILITVPVIFPIVMDMGYDPIWFGVIILMVQGMGIISPPVGVNVYIIHDVAKNVGCPITLEEIFKGIWPFLAAIFLCAVLLLIFPQIVTFTL